MKKDLDRVKRMAWVLKKIQDLHNVNLIAARNELAALREHEYALIEAFAVAPEAGLPFVKALGRKLNAAAQSTRVATDKVDELKAESVAAQAKHATFQRRAELMQADWNSSAERSDLNKVIEILANSSVSQANHFSLVVESHQSVQARQVSDQYSIEEEKAETS